MGATKIYSTNTFIKDYACMKFYSEAKPLNLETDGSGIGLGCGILQIRDGMNYPEIKHLTRASSDQLHLPTKAYQMQKWIQ